MGKQITIRVNLSEEQILDELVRNGIGCKYTYEKPTPSRAIKRCLFLVYKKIQEIGIVEFRKKYDI